MLSDKTHYRPGETVQVLSTGSVTARFGLNEEQTITGSFVPPKPGGYELIDSSGNSSVFTVADNIFDAGVGGNWGDKQKTGHDKWQGIPQKCLDLGVNLFELFFCAPCDFSQLVGSGSWASGQARYPENDAGIGGLVAACHAVGVSVGLYVNCHPCGPAGYALTQSHPEFFLRDGFGRIDGRPPDLADFPRWNDFSWTGVPAWNPFTLDLHNTNVVQYGIDQMLAAVTHYGFDYVRFDGHYTVAGNPNASIRNMLAVRQALAGRCLVGFNFGKGGDISSEGAVGLAGGGLYLQEQGASAVERNAVMGLGGSYYTLTDGDPFAHPYYANLPAAPGFMRWTPAQSAFARRWFPEFVWNRDLSPVAAGVKCLVDGARRYYVTEFSSPGTYQLGRATNVITPERGLQTNVSTAVIASIGLVVDEFAPVDPAGVIRCPALRDVSGVAAPIGGDGRQIIPDLSVGAKMFAGITTGPFEAGTYKVSYRLWVEPGTSGQITFQVQQPGGNALLKQYAHTPDVTNPANGAASLTLGGWLYQDYTVGEATVPAGMVNATCWAAPGAKGAVHLDSVCFIKQ